MVLFNSGEAEAERIYKAGQGQIQTMILKDENKRCDQTMFPYNAIPLFNELPVYIKETIGTEAFTEMLTEHYKNKCQHRVGKNPKSCSGCKYNEMLNEPIEVDYMTVDRNGRLEISFDTVTYASYRADSRTMKDVGNVMINVNKAVNTSIRQEKSWKQLVKVEETIWEDRKNTDAIKHN